MIAALAVAAAVALAVPITAAAQTPAPSSTVAPTPGAMASGATIEPGATVQLEYTLSDDAGKVLDSNKGQPPLTYTQGERQVIAALQEQLAGMHTGEAKKVVLKPEQAFGPVDPAAETEVPKEQIPADAQVVGAQLMARSASGEGRPVVVKAVRDKTVLIDLNHPLAGKTLVFDVKVVGVEAPAKAPAPKAAEPAAPDAKAADPKPAEPKAEESKPSK
jgi:FKBP-type peptidyl-prolyl cis-trans isomerase SlyD